MKATAQKIETTHTTETTGTRPTSALQIPELRLVPTSMKKTMTDPETDAWARHAAASTGFGGF